MRRASAIGAKSQPKFNQKKLSRRSSFFNVVQIYPSLDVVAIFQSLAFFRRLEVGARFIAPASFEQKRIPNLDFLLTGSSPLLETPLQNFLVRAALQRTNRQFVVIYSEESRAARVEHSRIIVHADKIIRRQFAASFKSDLVQHSGKVNKTFGFLLIRPCC